MKTALSLIKTSSTRKMNDLELCCCRRFDKIWAMFWSLRHLIGWIVSALGSRKDLILENLALRQQLLALHAQRRRPAPDRAADARSVALRVDAQILVL